MRTDALGERGWGGRHLFRLVLEGERLTEEKQSATDVCTGENDKVSEEIVITLKTLKKYFFRLSTKKRRVSEARESHRGASDRERFPSADRVTNRLLAKRSHTH